MAHNPLSEADKAYLAGYVDGKRYEASKAPATKDKPSSKPSIELTAGSSWQLWLWLAVLCTIPFLAGLLIGIGIGQG